jgi:RNA polymerase sigma-70 factor (ECF subfamily)
MEKANNERVKVEGFSLEALRSGDRAEFSRLVEAYSGNIYRLALRMLNSPQDAEDVLQETFLKAYRGLKFFDGRAKVSTWLFRIGTNEALMLLRKHKPELVSIDEPLETMEGEQEPVQIVDWCCLPEDELMSKEARDHLSEAVDQLPERLRVVFILRELEDLSTEETADVLGLSETAVKTRLSRARMRLRQDLSVYFSGAIDLSGPKEW